MSSYHYYGNDEGETIPGDVEELVVHPAVREIPYKACHCFEQLTHVKFNKGGSSVRAIGKDAFHGCVSLLDIEIPPSVTIIGDWAFAGCRSLSKVRFAEDNNGSSLLLFSLTTIGEMAFASCSSLIEINIPSSVETIRSDAFHSCTLLERVFFQEGLKEIEKGAFTACVQLEKVDIPNSLETLGGYAFYKCSSLQEVNFGEANLRVIEYSAFERCVKLQTIRIPSTVERLEPMTFKDCDSLRVMHFQNGLKCLEDQAFYSCKNLQAVALPDSVEEIYMRAFEECPKLVSVELGDHPRTVTIHDEAFSGCESLANICLPPPYASSPAATTATATMTTSTRTTGAIISDSFLGCTALENQYGETFTRLALMKRFEHFPIHKKCYHASVTATDDLAKEILRIDSSIQSSSQEGGTNITHAHRLIDDFGMTPFHILLSAANCRLDLLQVLLDAYPPSILGWEDVNGKTAIEYYCQQSYHRSEDSRNMLRMALHRWLVDSISSWKGLEAWKLDMSNRVNGIVAEEEVTQRQYLLQGASVALSLYERMEATSLLELSLWKMELNLSAYGTAIDKNNREAYRIRSGASVIIPNAVAFLYETNLA
ncbi:unnamed protein product [Cylindrotheca closterium]|uniref:Uncharacterized protein n=1 Tax=Cylindrotheca closterium TaxID=2856 RepID=A0AAD2GF07_9STRA|nr:unnamed protein product [Cylindrotheca closterium]